MKLTQIQKDCIIELKTIGMGVETTNTVMNYLETEEQQEAMIDFLIERIDNKVPTTESDILKAVIMITCEKKEKEIH